MTARRTIAFVGNCQAATLSTIYRKHVAPLLDEQVILATVVPGMADDELAEPLAQLAKADVIVEQRFDRPETLPVHTFDRPGVKRVRFPYVSGRLYWPYGGVRHIDAPTDRQPVGALRYPAELGDSFLNKMIRDAVPPDEALRQYDEAIAQGAGRISRMAELHLDRQRVRDADCGMAFADYIEANYRHELLFTTQGHPGLNLSRRLIGTVFEAIDVPFPLVTEVARSLTSAPFPPSEMPIHPGMAQVLGLEFVSPERRYRYGHEGHFTFAEFAARYMTYSWCQEMEDATTLLREGDPAGMVISMRLALRQCPGTASAWHLLAHALLQTERADEAEAAIRQALRIGPPSPEILSTLTHLLLQRENVAGAEAAIRQAIGLFPQDPAGYRSLAKLLGQRGQPEAGVAVARMATARAPADASTQWELAQCLQLAGRQEESAAALRQLLALEPDNAGAQALLDTMGPPPPLAALPGPVVERRLYRPITLEGLAALPDLRIDGRRVAYPLRNFPPVRLMVPAAAFGVPDASEVVEHPAVAAWLLHNVTVHGATGVISTAGCAIGETLDLARLALAPGAELDDDGNLHLPWRDPVANRQSGFPLLGLRDGHADWLRDLYARLGPTALVPGAEGDVLVQRLLCLPDLAGPAWATHPAVLPLFDKVREIYGTAVSERRLAIGLPEETQAVVEAAGFEQVAPAPLPLSKQVRMFSEASHIVAGHGKELANLVFCRPGTAVCELRPAGAPPIYRHLAAARGLRYGRIERAADLLRVLRDPLFG